MKKIFLLFLISALLAGLLASCGTGKEKIYFPVEKGSVWEYTGEHQVGLGPGAIRIPDIPFTLLVRKFRKSGEDKYLIFQLKMKDQLYKGLTVSINKAGEMSPANEHGPLLFSELWKGRAWSARLFGNRVSFKVRGKQKIITPAGEFDCWKLKFSGGRTSGTAWIADGVGLAALEYQSREPESVFKISLKLKKFQVTGEKLK